METKNRKFFDKISRGTMKFKGIQKYLSFAIKLILILSIINAVSNHLWYIMSTNIFLLILMFIPQIVKKSQIKIPHLTRHAETNIWLIKQFLNADFRIKDKVIYVNSKLEE